mgnify:CR=1 FL=1
MKDFINHVSRKGYQHSAGLLLIRVGAGVIFLVHGWEKFQNISMVIGFFGTLGFAPWVAYCIAGLEVVGGLALILGIASRFFGLLFGIEMLVAMAMVGSHKGFHGAEFEGLLSAVSFAIAAAGSGRYSLFKMECDHCGGMLCNGQSGDCPRV